MGDITQQEGTNREMVQSYVEERGERSKRNLMPPESSRRASERHPSILQWGLVLVLTAPIPIFSFPGSSFFHQDSRRGWVKNQRSWTEKWQEEGSWGSGRETGNVGRFFRACSGKKLQRKWTERKGTESRGMLSF